LSQAFFSRFSFLAFRRRIFAKTGFHGVAATGVGMPPI
jgi:hypothetical protein